MIEKTQPRIFHIHVDGKRLPEDLSKRMTQELLFTETNFSGHPEGYRHFEPELHLTKKIQTGQEFKKIWSELELTVKATPFVGYLEGEYIPTDAVISQKPYDASVTFPFQIERRRLSGEPNEQFRQSEIHLTMDVEKSDQSLVKKILDAGFYGAHLPKKDHTALILTIQGFQKDITPMIAKLIDYLHKAGGVVRGTIKEERAIRYHLQGITPQELPEIASKVTYHKDFQ